MKLVAGVDIGNSTTEACIASIDEYNRIHFLSSSITQTTGMKGTIENTTGIKSALIKALNKIGKETEDLDLVRLNEAAPVIGDTAMETITETIITESTMIGHNPDTPAGIGLGIGITVNIENIRKCNNIQTYIVIISSAISYEESAKRINNAVENGYKISAAIVQSDEAVLIYNRLHNKIPIVDEVLSINKVPLNMKACVEVASQGQTIKTLSNPYGIASIFDLNANETKSIIPIAKSLIGTKSAVVIKTPAGEVKEKVVPAGTITFIGHETERKVDIDNGAKKVMDVLKSVAPIADIKGEINTNVGKMIDNIKIEMAELTKQHNDDIKINDILAVDTIIPLNVQGALAQEVRMENAVGIAAMVKTRHLPMESIAQELKDQLKIFVKIAGVEAVMASLGALTTPGTKLPLAIMDLGGGSTDAAILDAKGEVKSIHLAGAGKMVTMLIDCELGLNNLGLAEQIKKFPLAKVESLFHIRMENGDIKFFNEPLSPKLFGKVIILSKEALVPINYNFTMEKIINIRIEAKKKVFVTNVIRALKQIAPEGNLKKVPNVVLVGGSALDFEIPELIFEELSKLGIICGRGNIRKIEGPRNAVATGLVMSYVG